MKKAKNELLQFLGGLAMLAVGLFILSQKVMVTSTFFGGISMLFGGFHVNNGIVIIPFIIGIVWMFASEGSFVSKVFTGLSVLLIIVAIILTTNLRLVRVTLFEWVLILVLIFGGAGLVARILLANPKSDSGRYDSRGSSGIRYEVDDIEKELEQMRKRR
ncbi:MAG: hypothetical protein J1F41_05080 [Lachnospiraceae bacterium]|nr:hypothetical protein [Lachnospiraceae bacterium]